MDWQTLLVHDGQTIVIATGCAVGVTALVFYRIKSRWGMHDEDRQHERDKAKERITWGEK
jgi:hypothetical protein